ncbi:IucA/IucC family C-terminal-domain containing protein [Bacillus pumilus]|uniref:IucA/IucC family C-terminal-domain containing protein n=1 Tax=Bacillus pumilus TaxID=1408 RepID=UPI00273ECC1C|nr:IucA/IucC family C-terminal-domain containing protein [Bacillus pumilus]WLP58944.1 IucA/IucC family C-terminal-domain containing protein [Bacillus pumilus]
MKPEWVERELLDFGVHITNGPMTSDRTLAALFSEASIRRLLEAEKEAMHAPNIAVASSMFSKRYAYLAVSSTLYMMTLYDGVYQFPPEACVFREDRKIEIDESLCSFVSLEGDRNEWREQVVHALFTECVTPLLDVLKRTSRLPYSVLWENVAVRINSLYRSMMREAEDLAVKQRVREDYLYLKQAAGNVFGAKQNPFHHSLNLDDSLLETSNRKTCCMYYKLEKKSESLDYCLVCPLDKKKGTACS